MPLEDMLLCILAKKGLSGVMEVRKYFQSADKEEQTVSKQDYFQQRKKLNPEVFNLLNRNYLKRFYDGPEAKRWHGYLIMAVDGSSGEIPDSKSNRKVYGESANQYGSAVARAKISALHDVFNRFILDIGIDRHDSSEREAAKAHIAALKEITGDRPVLLMFDRNYASLEFMDFIEKAGLKYLIRLHDTDYKAERTGMKCGDEEVELVYTKQRLWQIGQKTPGRAQEMGEKQSMPVRILKTIFANGEAAAFITNLKEGTKGEILRLYRKRWSIEQKLHTLKNKLKFESVTGKASIYVKQDYWAQALVYNMVQDLITVADRRIAKSAKKKGYKYTMRANENIAIGLFKEQLIRIMLEEDGRQKDVMLRQLVSDMEKNIVPVRKLKSAPRRWKHLNKYKCNQKPSF
jgi:hypothetical protein